MHLGGYNWDVFFENLCVLLFSIGWEVKKSSSNCLEESIASEKKISVGISMLSLDDTPLSPFKFSSWTPGLDKAGSVNRPIHYTSFPSRDGFAS